MKKITFFMCGLCAALFMSCTKTTGTENGHEWMDLGLPSGTKWATCNVGASKPEDYGNYYAWGETTTKRTYNWSTYKWCNGSYDTQNKYCTKSDYGRVDNKTVLDLEEDATRANWGGAWRMPTDAEWNELIYNCTWTWVENYKETGVNGYEVKGTNGNSIFLPAAGCHAGANLEAAGNLGNYWSSSLGMGNPNGAWGLAFTPDGVLMYYGNLRFCGLSVRPVFK